MLVALALTVWGVPPRAHALPGSGAPADAPTITLTDLGAGAPLEFYGQTGTTTLTFPVPPGLTPTTLNATVELPVYLRSAVITVVQDRRTVAQLTLPLVPRGPVDIPLAGVAVVDDAVTLTIHSYLLPLDDYCLDPTNPLRLVDGSVTYTGREVVPSVVAEFLPPVLRALTIAVPAEPSQAESDAAVRVAAAVVAHYGTQNTRVAVTSLDDGETTPADGSAPLERQIVIREGDPAGLSLQGGPGVPVLSISGPAAELTNQTRLIASDLMRLAVSSAAQVGPLHDSPQLPGDTTTLRELGEPGVSAESLAPRVVIGLDQTRFGRSTRGVRVHLVGSYTPVPENIGAQLVVRVGAQTIDRWAADSVGTIDRWVDVPDRLLQRFTDLEVAVDITGNTGRCGEFQPITLTIDGESVVQSTPARPPVPPGLQSLPQALMPRVEIGLRSGRFADTARAVSIMAGLQRLSALPVDTVVVDLQHATDSGNPAILISPDGWDQQRIPLPVTDSGEELTVAGADGDGQPVTLRLTPAVEFGSLQTVFDGERALVVATSNGAPQELDRLLRWLDEDPQRWPSLTGSAVISVPGHSPVTVPVAAEPQSQDRGDGGGGRVLGWVGAGVVAAGLIAAAALLLRRRRARPGS